MIICILAIPSILTFDQPWLEVQAEPADRIFGVDWLRLTASFEFNLRVKFYFILVVHFRVQFFIRYFEGLSFHLVLLMLLLSLLVHLVMRIILFLLDYLW